MNRYSTDQSVLTGRMLEVSRLATVGEMMSGVAHELNQPLTAITSFSQACIRLLTLPEPDIAEVTEALREISEQALRAGTIIRRIRELARHDNTERCHCDPLRVLLDIREMILSESRSFSSEVRWSVPRSLPDVFVDRVQIQHALLNLVRNALEAVAHLEPGTRYMEIGARSAEEGSIEYFVCDNGAGVDSEVRARLGEPFVTTKPRGTGLGLAIVNTVARAHEGSFHYTPNEPRGSCFILRMPVSSRLVPA